MKAGLFFLLILSLLLLTAHGGSSSFAATSSTDEIATLDGFTADKVDSVLAKMSDEQVRTLLLSELAKDLEQSGAVSKKGSGGLAGRFAGWQHLLDPDKRADADSATGGILSAFVQLPGDYIAVASKIGNGSFGRFIINLVLIAVVFAVASLAEFGVRRLTAEFSKQFREKTIPELDGPMRFAAGIMRSIPSFIHILVFSISAVLFFYLLPLRNHLPVSFLFLSLLFIVIFYRMLDLFSRIICAPTLPSLRVLSVDDNVAETLHRSTLFLGTYTFSALMFLGLLLNLQLAQASFSISVIVAATGLIVLIIAMILRSRNAVQQKILEESERNKSRNWITELFAQFWHVPTIFYFAVVWIILVNRELSGEQAENGAFMLSLLILPLYIIFDGVGQWIVRVSIKTLRIYNPEEEEAAAEDEELKEKLAQARERERTLRITSGRLVHLGVIAILLIWVLSLWGYPIPYATTIIQAAFQSLVAMAIGLVTWRFASSYIERKIAEATPEEEEKEEDNDSEFGNAAQRGRSYTLLPMLRKFIASILLVMVVLVVFSSIGVDIGPMLAGAGVVGLAIGFGAQKLVSDVFSGFFYLLDDAFRVGEYIQAGSVSGAVEAITLRNVMLRHHRGMLQIVPHSDLGSITNFMRGGLVIKFNLEFPYDTDIDKVRKIIKKVGQAMLKDEEFGQDFIQPVKSQGVRQITDSVMVIRVKFTAQPGTQFVIQREAFRRITEALVAKGIHYAHRKVIVELPEAGQDTTPEEQQRIAEAGAAAGLARIKEDEKKQVAAEGGSSGGGMMGM